MKTQEFYASPRFADLLTEIHERNEIFRNIRHLCNTCQPPKHLTIEMLTSILETLRGTTPITDKGE